MDEYKKMTASDSPVAAGEKQSPSNDNTIISEIMQECNSSEGKYTQKQLEILQMLNPAYLPTFTLHDLYQMTFEPKPPIIDGLLYTGAYLFVGAPKIGKSFLMAQLAYHVSTGTPLWGYSVRRGTVLYFALEDDEFRLLKRFSRMFGTEEPYKLKLSIKAKQIGKGLDEQIAGFIGKHSDTSLVILDTLQKIREMSSDAYSYASDYEVITKLKRLADKYHICIAIVHHTRKQQSEDKFDMISGTNGLLGAADAAFLMYKEKRTSNSAILEVSGRDQQDQRLFLTRNMQTLVWELEKAETELWDEPAEPLLDEVAKLLTEKQPEWNGTATELVEALGLDIKPNTLTLKLNVNVDRLLTAYNIRYTSSRSHKGRSIRLQLEL